MYNYGYDDYGYGLQQAGQMLGTMLIIAGIMSIVSIVFVVLMIIGQWKCFKKAGYKGWEALIAGHNQFVNCTFAGVNPILVLGVLFGSIVLFVPVIGWLAYIGFLIYYQVVVGLNTAKAFGKGTGFGIALAIPLSAPIAWFILGKDENVYVGPKSNNRGDQLQVQKNNPVSNEQPVITPVIPTPEVAPAQQPNFCTNCGNQLSPGTRFCTNCGKQL